MNNNKKNFVNVFKSSWDRHTPKVSSLFKIEKIYEKITEGVSVAVMVKVSMNKVVTREMLTEKDYGTLCKGIICTGVSKLHEGDTWNEQVGSDIAEHRAMMNAYNTISNMLCNKYEEMQLQLKSITHINSKFLEKRYKQCMCAKKLGGN